MADEIESTVDTVVEGEAPAIEQDTSQGEPIEKAAEGDDTPKQPSRAQQRVLQALSQRDEAKAEVERLRAELATKEIPPTPKPKPTADKYAGHPALMGQEPDEAGQVYIGGKWKDADDLIERHEIKQALEAIANEHKADVEARKQAEVDAKEARARADLAEAVSNRISEIRAERLPGVPEEGYGAVDKLIGSLADGAITEAYVAGKLTADLAEQILARAIDEARHVFGYMGQAQFESNQQYKDQNKVKPGQAVTKPEKTMHELTPREKEEAARKAFEAAIST